MSELIIDKLTTRDGSNVGAIVVADIDELLLLNTNKEINTTAIVKDSNRGGVFNYDGAQSGVNNGGTIFNGWVRQYEGAVNVKWFGAVGDGVVDDTTAIQTAMDAASAVFFPVGTYITSAALDYNNNQIIQGAGKELSIIKRSSGGTHNMFFPNIALGTGASPSNVSVDNVMFKDITLDADMTSSGDFIESIMIICAISAKFMTISNVTFKNPSGDCIYISQTYGDQASTVIPYDVKINNCTFKGNNINRNAITVITGQQLNFSHNHFYKITSSSMPCPIDLEPNEATEIITNVVIANNTFDSCKGGISTYRTGAGPTDYTMIQNISITGNTFTNPAQITPYVSQGTSDIGIYNARNVTVISNCIYDSNSIGITISESYGVTVNSNNIFNANEVGVFIKDVFNTKIDNNNISLENDTYNGYTCVGIKASTAAFTASTNHTMEHCSLNDNTIINTVSTPLACIGIVLEGNAYLVNISGDISGFYRGLYLGKKADVYPSKISVKADLSLNTLPLNHFSTGFVPDHNIKWSCGEGISWGVASFSSSTSKIITGIHVYTTSAVRVTRKGSVGLANNLTIECPVDGQLNITSEASESGEFLWEVVSP